MKGSNGKELPKAREKDLVTRQIPGELLVYDLKRHKAFCLNETAAAIWKGCNGRRDVSELAQFLGANTGSSVDERVVWLALDQLKKSNLLRQRTARSSTAARVSRRDLLRIGIAGAVALPLVVSISAPTAEAAGTPVLSATCQGRHHSDPGGCGGNPCSDVAGTFCLQNGVSNACKCQ